MIYKNINLSIIIIFTFLFFNSISYSQTKYAGEFLNIGAGVRALGMGGAFTGISDDSTASYWNPAGLIQIEKTELTVMYSNMFSGIVQYSFLNAATHNFAIPFGFPFLLPFKTHIIPGYFGISIISVSVPDLPYLPQTSGNDTLFNSQDYASLEANTTSKGNSDQELGIYLSYSFPEPFFEVLALGFNIKYIQQKISYTDTSYSASGSGFDIGLLYTGLKSKGIKVGLNIQDVTSTPIKWNTASAQTDKIPLSTKLGLAYTTKLPLTKATNISLDLDTKYGNSIYFGTELWFSSILAIRVGYRQLGGPKTTMNNLTTGLGLKFLNNYSFDYAFLGLMDNDLGDIQRASLSIKF